MHVHTSAGELEVRAQDSVVCLLFAQKSELLGKLEAHGI